MQAATQTQIQPSKKERRRAPRVGLITQVECTAMGDYTLGRSQDLSEGGLSVEALETFESGNEVVVRFNLPPYPPGIPVESQGMIVRVQPPRTMGIQLPHLSDRQREVIARYVRQAEEGNI